MPTATLTEERETLSQISYPEVKAVRTWPELRQPPQNALRVPLLLRKGQKVKMPRGISPQLTTSPPATAWPRIMEAIPEFGLRNLYIYAPEKAFLERGDPAIIAEKDGKFYLIAAWE